MSSSVRTASPLPTTTRRKRCFQVGDNAKISVRPKDTVDPGKITNGGPIRGRLHIKTTQVPPFAVFQYSSPSFPYITHFPLQIFHTCAKICRSANHRCIFICIYIYFFEFSCVWKVILLLILALLKKISWKESKFKTIKRRDASDDGERGNKKFREQAVCDLSSSQESISTQSIKKCDAFMN